MKRIYSLAHLTAIACPPPEFIYLASMAGYDRVGVRPIPMRVAGEVDHDFARNRELFRSTKQALDDTGIEINDIEVARVYDGVQVREEFEPALAAGAELGAKHLTTSVWSSDRNYCVDKFCEICDLAAVYAMTVNVEFVTWAHVRNIAETISLLERAGRTNVGILVDALHFYRSRDTVDEIEALPASLFNYVHLCDAPAAIPTDKEALIKTGRGERLYVGEGAIDMRAIVDRLPQATVALELPHLQRATEIGYAEHARRCLATCKAYLGDD